MFGAKISKELQRRVFDLTLALYRVTDFFPQGEVLRHQLREKANEIFGMLSEYNYLSENERAIISILGKIEAIKGYIRVARARELVRPINLSVIEREYDLLTDFLQRALAEEEKNLGRNYGSGEEQKSKHRSKENRDVDNTEEKLSKDIKVRPIKNGTTADIMEGSIRGINERQEKIVAYLKKTTSAKISDFYAVFSDISSKTIQRDLQDLVIRNILKKDGEKRWTVYCLTDVRYI